LLPRPLGLVADLHRLEPPARLGVEDGLADRVVGAVVVERPAEVALRLVGVGEGAVDLVDAGPDAEGLGDLERLVERRQRLVDPPHRRERLADVEEARRLGLPVAVGAAEVEGLPVEVERPREVALLLRQRAEVVERARLAEAVGALAEEREADLVVGARLVEAAHVAEHGADAAVRPRLPDDPPERGEDVELLHRVVERALDVAGVEEGAAEAVEQPPLALAVPARAGLLELVQRDGERLLVVAEADVDGGEDAAEPPVRLARGVEPFEGLRHEREGGGVVGEEVEGVPFEADGEGAALGVAQALGERPRLAGERQPALRLVEVEAVDERVERVHARRALLAEGGVGEAGFEDVGGVGRHGGVNGRAAGERPAPARGSGRWSEGRGQKSGVSGTSPGLPIGPSPFALRPSPFALRPPNFSPRTFPRSAATKRRPLRPPPVTPLSTASPLRVYLILFALWLVVFSSASQTIIVTPILPVIGAALDVEPASLG